MTRYTISAPKIEKDTTEILVLSTGGSFRLRPLLYLLLALFLGLALLCASLAYEDWAPLLVVLLFFLVAIVIIRRFPRYVKLTVDRAYRQLMVEKTRLLGLVIFPRRIRNTFPTDYVTSLESTENLLSTAFSVKLNLADGTIIILETRDGALAATILRKLQALLDYQPLGKSSPLPAMPPGVTLPAPAARSADAPVGAEFDDAIPFTGWRLALAVIYGLLVALVAAWAWLLVARATNTRYGAIALLIGFAVGTVVSLMAGGSRDQRYALAGAGLSAFGVFMGELMIFGNLELANRYELDFVTIVFYLLAVYEGWVIPRRSMRLVRQFGGAVSESRQRPLFFAGLLALLVLVTAGLFFGIVPLPSEVVASYHSNRAYAYLEEEDLSAAEVEMVRALDLAPEWALGNAILGDIYRGTFREAEAEHAYLRALEQDAQLPLAQLGLAILYYRQSRTDEALEMAEMAKASPETSGLAHLLSGTIHFDAERWPEAERDLDVALKSELDQAGAAAARLLKGYALLYQGSYEEALAMAESIIGLDPNNAEGHHLYGLASFNLGQLDAARESLQSALELGLRPADAEAARTMLSDLD